MPSEGTILDFGRLPKPISITVRFFSLLWEMVKLSFKVAKFEFVSINVFVMSSRNQVEECSKVCEKAVDKYFGRK